MSGCWYEVVAVLPRGGCARRRVTPSPPPLESLYLPSHARTHSPSAQAPSLVPSEQRAALLTLQESSARLDDEGVKGGARPGRPGAPSVVRRRRRHVPVGPVGLPTEQGRLEPAGIDAGSRVLAALPLAAAAAAVLILFRGEAFVLAVVGQRDEDAEADGSEEEDGRGAEELVGMVALDQPREHLSKEREKEVWAQ